MRIRNPFVQAGFIVLLAFVLAIGANAFASRTRRLLLVGYYPNALRMPPRNPAPVPPPPRPAAALQTPSTNQQPEATETRAAATTAAPQSASPAATATTTKAPDPGPAPAPRPAPAADPLARFRPHPDQPSADISGEEALLLHRAGVLFLDARRTSVYEERHIAGARSFPVWEADVDDRVNQLFGERGEPEQQSLPIVIYCSGGECEDSHMLAQKLWGIQFNNVYVYKDGFPDWQKRGGPVRTGAQP